MTRCAANARLSAKGLWDKPVVDLKPVLSIMKLGSFEISAKGRSAFCLEDVVRLDLEHLHVALFDGVTVDIEDFKVHRFQQLEEFLNVLFAHEFPALAATGGQRHHTRKQQVYCDVFLAADSA